MKKITVKDLKPGDTFTFLTRKNARRYTVHKTTDNPVEEIQPPKFKCSPSQYGDYLVILEGCGQLQMPPDTVLYLIHG